MNEKEDIVALKVHQQNMMDKIEDIKESFDSKHSDIKTTLDKFIDSADSKYSLKRVEKFNIGIIGLFASAIVGAICYLILK